jgi:DNA-binding NarL/FixJ family response regulator
VANSLMFREGLAFTLRSDHGFEVIHASSLAEVPFAISEDPVTVAVVTWDRSEEAIDQLFAGLDAVCVAAPVVLLADHAPTQDEAAYISNKGTVLLAKRESIAALVHAIRAAANMPFGSADRAASL